MFPAAPAALFHRNIEFWSYVSLFSRSITSCQVFLHCVTISTTHLGSDKPVCHGGAKVRYSYPRSVTIISTFFYGLLRSDVTQQNVLRIP